MCPCTRRSRRREVSRAVIRARPTCAGTHRNTGTQQSTTRTGRRSVLWCVGSVDTPRRLPAGPQSSWAAATPGAQRTRGAQVLLSTNRLQEPVRGNRPSHFRHRIQSRHGAVWGASRPAGSLSEPVRRFLQPPGVPDLSACLASPVVGGIGLLARRRDLRRPAERTCRRGLRRFRRRCDRHHRLPSCGLSPGVALCRAVSGQPRERAAGVGPFVSDPCETSRGRHCVQTWGLQFNCRRSSRPLNESARWTDAVTTIAAGRRRARFATQEPAGFRSVTWVDAAKVGPVGAHPSALRRKGHYSDAGRLRSGRPTQYTRLRDQEWSGRASHPVATVPGSGLALSVAPGAARSAPCR
jgi:hypothetical protein